MNDAPCIMGEGERRGLFADRGAQISAVKNRFDQNRLG